MSFQKIDQKEAYRPEGRECILIYGFAGKDFQKLKRYCTMVGVRDIIEIQQDMLDIRVSDILEGNINKADGEQGPKDRAIVFNAFSGQKLNTFIGNFKSSGLVQPLLATVTPTSIEWGFRDLISELQREREAIAKSTEALDEDSHKES